MFRTPENCDLVCAGFCRYSNKDCALNAGICPCCGDQPHCHPLKHPKAIVALLLDTIRDKNKS